MRRTFLAIPVLLLGCQPEHLGYDDDTGSSEQRIEAPDCDFGHLAGLWVGIPPAANSMDVRQVLELDATGFDGEAMGSTQLYESDELLCDFVVECIDSDTSQVYTALTNPAPCREGTYDLTLEDRDLRVEFRQTPQSQPAVYLLQRIVTVAP